MIFWSHNQSIIGITFNFWNKFEFISWYFDWRNINYIHLNKHNIRRQVPCLILFSSLSIIHQFIEFISWCGKWKFLRTITIKKKFSIQHHGIIFLKKKKIGTALFQFFENYFCNEIIINTINILPLHSSHCSLSVLNKMPSSKGEVWGGFQVPL